MFKGHTMSNQQPPSNVKSIHQSREGSGVLKLWLIGVMLANMVVAYTLWQSVNELSSFGVREVASRASFLLGFLGIWLVMLFVCVVATWKWKRWGVYGIVILTLLNPIVTFLILPIGIRVGDLISPVVQLLILYLLVKAKWHAFE